MYHIVICDDEPIFLTQISKMIIDILASMGESCEIRKYTSISELKNTLQNTPKSCDIVQRYLSAEFHGLQKGIYISS